ncbi:MAG: DUF2817 domain-containing protein [Pirellulales bacterium]|nr:DUF2817 domain-containing protein [Pirellulales bacterium]
MKTQRTIPLILVCVFCWSSFVNQASSQEFETPAEATDFQAGPTMYGPMMEFLEQLQTKSSLLNIRKLTSTLRGRDVVLCVMSDPPVYRPADVINSDKPIVLIVSNVHGAEVAGKDATLMLVRDLVVGELKSLLKETVVLVVPNINPDGTEARRRTNEEGFDLNRDYLKLESQEIRALVTQVINKWQPDLHVDTHNGGSAPYTLVYQTNMNPAGDKELMWLGNEVVLPRIREALREEDYDGFWYSGPRSIGGVPGWAPTSVEARKQHVYSTLANMLGFLFETPSGTHRVIENGTKVVPIPSRERYRHQVRGQYIGQREVVRFAADQPEMLRRTVLNAKRRATELGHDDSDDDQVILSYRQVAKYMDSFWIRNRNRQEGQDAYTLVNQPVFTQFVPIETTTRPWGYILPPQLASVVPLLLDHEITVKRIEEPITVEVESYMANSVRNTQYYQGHYLKSVDVDKVTRERSFPSGSFFVPSGQPKSNLISYLLEPQTDDNLVTWEFLNRFVRLRDRPAPPEDSEAEDGSANEQGAEGGEAAGNRRRRGGRQRSQRGQQLIPIHRVMKQTTFQSTLVDVFNDSQRNRYVR